MANDEKDPKHTNTSTKKSIGGAVALLMTGIDMEMKKPKNAAKTKKTAENPNAATINKWFAQEHTGARGRRFLKRKRH